MEKMISMPASTPKTVSLSLTIEIDAWLKGVAERRGIKVAQAAREVFEKAMRESEAEETKESAA